MGYIDQFVASLSFNAKKVIEFRNQNVWKSILYVVVFVVATGLISTFLRWDDAFESLRDVLVGSDFDDESMVFIHALTQQLTILVDLLVHFTLISVIAYAGCRGYRLIRKIPYKEAWNVTAYGVSAPILGRLFVQGLGGGFQVMPFIYWGAVMIFSMTCLKAIVNLEK